MCNLCALLEPRPNPYGNLVRTWLTTLSSSDLFVYLPSNPRWVHTLTKAWDSRGVGNGIERIRLNRFIRMPLLDYHTIVLGCAGHIRKTYVYLCYSLSSVVKDTHVKPTWNYTHYCLGCVRHLRKTYVNPRVPLSSVVKDYLRKTYVNLYVLLFSGYVEHLWLSIV